MFGARRVARRTARRTSRRTSRRMMAMAAPPPPPPPSSPGAPPPAATGPPVNYVLLAGEGSSPPIKLTQQDAQRIQESAGIPVDQLEDNDLKEEMQQLNIHPVPLTPQDQAALGIAPTPQGTTTTIMHPSAPPAQPSLEQQLTNLDGLKHKGLITEDEYTAKKRQILGI